MVVLIVGLDVIIIDLRVLRNNQRDANAVKKMIIPPNTADVIEKPMKTPA